MLFGTSQSQFIALLQKYHRLAEKMNLQSTRLHWRPLP